MRDALAATFWAISFGIAYASEIPAYAIDQSCTQFAEYAVGGAVERRESLTKDCIRDQRAALDRLKTDWSLVSDADQALCLRMTGEAANYRSLGNCVRSLVARRLGKTKAINSGEH